LINRLHSWLNRPEKGWDPVPQSHVLQYGAHEWAAGVQESLLDELDQSVGGLAGKQVLDLGGGPGHYSVAFARRGASVTWFDISKNYRDFVQQKAREAQVEMEFALGYMDHAHRLLNRQFDLVFNRICFSYCIADASFAGVIHRLVKPGGWAYVDTNNADFGRESAGLGVRSRNWLNGTLGVKIGHPYPPRGRITELFLRHPLRRLSTEFLPRNDRILFQKPGGPT
jgi:2-polyprenyl-3-methyl-5-hydroxy-6-metoxy-1,4-benzoquinol methylase